MDTPLTPDNPPLMIEQSNSIADIIGRERSRLHGFIRRRVPSPGDALRNVAWTPGDKIQLQLGGWTQRTYTPLDWDAVHGRTRILVHLSHPPGSGPANVIF